MEVLAGRPGGLDDALRQKVSDRLSPLRPVRAEDMVERAVLPDDDDDVLDRALGIAAVIAKLSLVAIRVRGCDRRYDLAERERARRHDSRHLCAPIRHLSASRLTRARWDGDRHPRRRR